MARQFFKDLPDTTTPLTASRLNGLLDGEEAMGNLVVESIRTKNMFDKNAIRNGYRLDSSGNLFADSGYFTSDFISIDSSTQYTFSRENANSGGLAAYALYDSNKTFISRSAFITTTTVTFTSASNAKYIKIDDLNNNLNSLQLEEGSTATTYSEYQALNPKNYVMYTDNNSWVIKKYNDGTFEAFYPFTASNSTTSTNSLFGNYSSATLTLPLPDILSDNNNLIYYDLNASFTNAFSFAIAWPQASNFAYKIVSSGQVSTATPYRLSAYISGKY